MIASIGNSEVRKIVGGFVALGWVVEGKKKHVVVRNPADPSDRLTVSHGGNPPGYELLKRMKSRLRRAEAASLGKNAP